MEDTDFRDFETVPVPVISTTGNTLKRESYNPTGDTFNPTGDNTNDISIWAKEVLTRGVEFFLHNTIGRPTENVPLHDPPVYVCSSERCTVIDRLRSEHDLAVARATLQYLQDFAETAQRFRRAYDAEIADIERVRVRWDGEVGKMIRDCTGAYHRAMQRLEQEWSEITGKRKGRGKLSERILRYLHGITHETHGARRSFDDDAVQELDAEIARLTSRSSVPANQQITEEVLRLMRRRTQFMDRATIAAIKQVTNEDEKLNQLSKKNAVSLLKEARKWESNKEGVHTVEWRLRDTIKQDTTNALETQFLLLRSNLEEARRVTILSFDKELDAMQHTVDRHVERVRQHEEKEPLPIISTAGLSQDIRKEVMPRIEALFSRAPTKIG